jgi:hypothetical protein
VVQASALVGVGGLTRDVQLAVFSVVCRIDLCVLIDILDLEEVFEELRGRPIGCVG